jgi:hypothetical protein
MTNTMAYPMRKDPECMLESHIEPMLNDGVWSAATRS